VAGGVVETVEEGRFSLGTIPLTVAWGFVAEDGRFSLGTIPLEALEDAFFALLGAFFVLDLAGDFFVLDLAGDFFVLDLAGDFFVLGLAGDFFVLGLAGDFFVLGDVPVLSLRGRPIFLPVPLPFDFFFFFAGVAPIFGIVVKGAPFFTEFFDPLGRPRGREPTGTVLGPGFAFPPPSALDAAVAGLPAVPAFFLGFVGSGVAGGFEESAVLEVFTGTTPEGAFFEGFGEGVAGRGGAASAVALATASGTGRSAFRRGGDTWPGALQTSEAGSPVGTARFGELNPGRMFPGRGEAGVLTMGVVGACMPDVM